MTDAEAVDAAYLKLVDRTQDFLNFLELEGVEYPLFGRTWDVRAPAQRRQAALVLDGHGRRSPAEEHR